MSSYAHESQRFSKLFERVSALFMADYPALEIDFSALIRSEAALFRDFQVMNSAESELKQRWSTLIISESEVISAEILRDLNSGLSG